MRLDPWPAARPAGRSSASTSSAAGSRSATATPAPRRCDVSFHYGFPADIGGGSYERRKWLVADDPAAPLLRLQVEEGVSAFPTVFPTVVDALDPLGLRPGRPARLRDLRSSTAAPTRCPRSITLADTTPPGDRGRATASGPSSPPPAGGFKVGADGTNPDPEQRGRLTLSGVVVEGFVRVTGDLAELRILHSTLVPGPLDRRGRPRRAPRRASSSTRPSGGTQLNTHLALELASSISGPIDVPGGRARNLDPRLASSTASAAARSATARADRPRGAARPPSARPSSARVRVHELEGERVDLHGPHRHGPHPGRLRPLLVRPARLAHAAAAPLPARSRASGRSSTRRSPPIPRSPSPSRTRSGPTSRPGSLPVVRHDASTASPPTASSASRRPREIRTGAEDGSEMGAYCQLKQPQRESNLRIRLDEYLPVRARSRLIYVDLRRDDGRRLHPHDVQSREGPLRRAHAAGPRHARRRLERARRRCSTAACAPRSWTRSDAASSRARRPDAFLIVASAVASSRSAAAVRTSTASSPSATAPAPHAFDPVLGEDFGIDPVDYLDQPYLPERRTPLARRAGTYLAYLDVWQREVTALEDPDLRREGDRRRHGDADPDRLAGAPARGAAGDTTATRSSPPGTR